MNPLTIRKLLFAFVIASAAFSVAYALFLLLFVFGTAAQIALGTVFAVLTLVVAALNILMCYYFYASYFARAPKCVATSSSRVAVAVPTCDEDAAMVEDTLLRLKRMRYPRRKLEFWLLDNSTIPALRERLKRFCAAHGVRYLYHPKEKGYKAGSLNNLLRHTRAPFLAVFDADEKLRNADFLLENLGYFEDERVAFVQTAKRYRKSGLFANSVDASYAFFYNFVQPLRSKLGMAMYCGSCGILRAGALRELGGFPCEPPTPTEDTAFSLKADIAGYRGLYNPKAYALGEPIERYSTFVRQQWKYVFGNAKLLGEYLRNLGRIAPQKHVHYASQLIGFPYFSLLFVLYALVTVAFVLNNFSITVSEFLQPVFTPSGAALNAINVSPIVMTMLTIVVISRFYFGSFRIGIIASLLNLALAFQRSRAAFHGLTRDFMDIVTTGKLRSQRINGFAEALRFTKMETLYSSIFLLFAALSLLRGDIADAFWLLWYAALFYSALFLAWRYK